MATWCKFQPSPSCQPHLRFIFRYGRAKFGRKRWQMPLCWPLVGGVRAFGFLNLMEYIDPENPPKPCEYFDIICGASAGGLIAIMLGRLQMTVAEVFTNDWIWRRLVSFVKEASGILWIRGTLGSGKYALAKSIQQRVLENLGC